MSEQTPNETQDKENKKGLIPFFPDYLLDEIIAWYIALAILVALASLFPAGLEEQANPISTPEHVKPEWYFLFFYQFLKLVPRIVGVLVAGIGIVLLFLVPFLDRSPSRTPRARRAYNALGVITLIVTVGLSIWGWLS
jgi:quinol-cytochrome oxidoreductase complex cytochrome b subunit